MIEQEEILTKLAILLSLENNALTSNKTNLEEENPIKIITPNKKEENKNENNIKEEDENFGICPITQELMKNPVLAPSGYYYEKDAILNWIKRNGTDPFTRETLNPDLLVEDNDYKKLINEYKKKFNKVIYY